MNESKASRYQRLRRRAHVAGVASGGACLALLALTPAAGFLARWSSGLGAAVPLHLGALATTVTFVAAVVVLWEIVALPAVLYVGLSVDRRFKAADRSVEGVLAAQAQATLVALVAAVTSALIVFAAARLAGAFWWLFAGGSLAMALVAAVLVFWAVVLLETVSPVVGGAALVFAGLVGLIDALFVTATRIRVEGSEIEVRSVARSTTYDAYALIARRASGHRYGLATKERPHHPLAWLRERDLAALRSAGVDIG
jgi:hypothetical protein